MQKIALTLAFLGGIVIASSALPRSQKPQERESVTAEYLATLPDDAQADLLIMNAITNEGSHPIPNPGPGVDPSARRLIYEVAVVRGDCAGIRRVYVHRFLGIEWGAWEEYQEVGCL